MKRYNESAKIESDILLEINRKGGSHNGIVLLKEYFFFKDSEGEHMCLSFEPLGKSLYDFIKANDYKGMHLIKQTLRINLIIRIFTRLNLINS